MSSTRKDYLTGVFKSTLQTRGEPLPEKPTNFDHGRLKQERSRPVKDDLDWIDRLEMLDAIFDD